MSDRLIELQRQRALLQEHLAWIDHEIAAETNRPGVATPQGRTAPIPPLTAPVSARAGAEAILSEYETDQKSLKNDVRKGCLLYLAIAFALVGLGVLMLYFYSRSLASDRPPRAPPAARAESGR
ncbi:MAG: hypothetical protein PHQ04_04585 [Opitutaceae bacterium]|nr:hypothetical protein [Opitutaceae bacterium]